MGFGPPAGGAGSDADGGSRSFSGEPFESWRDGNLVATPEQVCEKIRAYEKLGLGGVVARPADFPDTTTVRLLGEQVIPGSARGFGRSAERRPQAARNVRDLWTRFRGAAADHAK